MAEAKITAADRKISKEMQSVAHAIAETLASIADQRVNFSLFVWTEGRTQYVSNALRPDVVKALEETMARWREGQPDTPPHKVQ
ncbi:hypothetical protein [Inquilinus sp. CA228]|uniref:hypothetical protein n=1 Tax=Inquilinus sp. CA228 TaxID=3455609 RepID=UPI003F8D6E4F